MHVFCGHSHGVAYFGEVHHGGCTRWCPAAHLAPGLTLGLPHACGGDQYEITAVRFFTQWLCSAITIVYEYKAHNVSLRVGREFWAGMAARLVFGVLSMVCGVGMCGHSHMLTWPRQVFFYLALQHLAMANASVIRFTSPAMVSVLAFFLYKEEFGWVQGISTVMSMAGVVLVAQPHFIFGSPHVSQPVRAPHPSPRMGGCGVRLTRFVCGVHGCGSVGAASLMPRVVEVAHLHSRMLPSPTPSLPPSQRRLPSSPFAESTPSTRW